MTILERLGGWVTAPAPVTPRLGLHVLDTLGAWLAGRRTAEAAELATLTQGELPVLTAALPDRVALRVATTRLSEVDDIHLGACVTPGAVVVSTALAVAARTAAEPADFAAALRAGYGTMIWLGRAFDGPHIIYRGIWPTYLLAPLGAAAVTARLLGLGARETTNALALALSQVSGGPGNPGELSPRWLLAGWAARAGCSAALAAARGFAGDTSLLENDWLHRTHGIVVEHALLAEAPAADGLVSELSIKTHCAAKQTTAASTALSDLLANGLRPEQIAEIRVHVPPPYAAMIGHHQTGHRIGRITGVAYQLACLAWQKDTLFDLERPDLTSDARIAALLGRIVTVVDDDLGEYYPARWPARLDVLLQDGTRMERLVVDANGDPGRALDEAAVRGKFAIMAGEHEALGELALASVQDGAALAELCQQVDRL